MKPELTRLLGRAWPMHPGRFHAMAASFSADQGREPRSAEDRAKRSSSPLRNGVELRAGAAVIPVSGPIFADAFLQDAFEYFGLVYTDPNDVTAAVDKAMADPRVSGILLAIDSPGGEISGVQTAAEAIWQARQSGAKPINAHVTGLAASAAYWLGSQAEQVTAEPSAEIGSIGVYCVIEDLSALAAQLGIRVNVVSSGPDKGAFVPGTPVTDAQLEPVQETIDDLAALFRSDVGRGRGASAERVAEWSSGRCWVAGRALAMGLIDSVGAMDAALAGCTPDEKRRRSEFAAGMVPAAVSAEGNSAQEQEGTMPDLKPAAPAAPPTDPVAEFAAKNPQAVEAWRAEGVKKSEERFTALASEFKDEPAFVVAQFAQGADVEKARVAFKDLKLERLAQENAELKAKAAEAPKPAAPAASPVGADPVAHAEGGAGADPEAKLKSAYEAEVAKGTFHLGFETYKAMAKGLEARGR